MRALGRGTVRPRNVYSRRRLPRRRANAPPFTFITPSHNVRTRVSYRDERRSARERLRPLGYPATRAHVRLLGPCFKTGRKEARRFVADRRRRERYEPAETSPSAASITRAQSYRPRRKTSGSAPSPRDRARRPRKRTRNALRRIDKANGSRRPAPAVRRVGGGNIESTRAGPARGPTRVGPEFRAPGFTGSVRLPPNGFTYY